MPGFGKVLPWRGTASLVLLASAGSLAGCAQRGKGPVGGNAPPVPPPEEEPVPAEDGEEGRKGEVASRTTRVVTVTDANFGELTRSGVVLVDFWAPWCGPCMRQGPLVEKIAGSYAGRAVAGKLNVDEHKGRAEQLGLQFLPTLIVFRNGQEFRRLTGMKSEQDIRTALDAALGED